MSYVDFDHVRRQVSVEQAAAWLGLNLKKVGQQFRGPCPLHDSGSRALVLTPAENVWYCFAPQCHAGGGVIELVMKVRGLGDRDAALALQEHFLDPHRSVGSAENPLSKIDYLQPDHEAVAAYFPPEVARAIGAGYAPRGTMAKRVLVPIRTETGKLIGYIGIGADGSIKLPGKFHL